MIESEGWAMYKKLAALLLAFAMLMGQQVFADDAETMQIDSEKFEVLNTLDLFDGKTQEQLHSAYISKSEYSRLLAGVVNASSAGGNFAQSYLDVPQEHWAFTYIEQLKAMGIYTAEEKNFYPEDYVTRDFVMETIRRALGYSDELLQSLNDEGLVNSRLSGLFSGVSAEGTYLRYDDIITVLYNALNMEVLTFTNDAQHGWYETYKGETMLVYYHHKELLSGYVVSTGNTTIEEGFRVSPGEVCILLSDGRGDVLSTEGDSSIERYLGYHVTYMKELMDGENDKLVYYALSGRTTVTTVTTNNIAELDGNRLYYYTENDKLQYKTLDRDAKYIYNGVCEESLESSDFSEGTGKIIFIENPAMDVVRLEMYSKELVVDVVQEENQRIIDRYSNDNELDLSDVQEYKIYLEDVELTLQDIRQNDVIDVAYSKDGSVMALYVTRSSVQGVVNGSAFVGEKQKLLINGEGYELSEFCIDRDAKTGSTVEAFMNAIGEVAGYRYVSFAYEYGYVLKIVYDEGTEESQLLLLTKEGGSTLFDVENRVNYGIGTASRKIQARDLGLYVSNGDVIKFKLNGDMKITGVICAKEQDNGVSDEDQFTKIGPTTSYVYRNTNFQNIFFITPDTAVFFAPDDSDATREDFVGMNGGSAAAALLGGQSYRVDLYDKNDFYQAGAVVVHAYHKDAYINDSGKNVIVNSLNEAVDETGEIGLVLEYMEDGTMKEAFIDPLLVREGVNSYTLDQGDLIRIGILNDKIIRIENAFDCDKKIIYRSNSSVDGAKYYTSGTVTRVTSGGVELDSERFFNLSNLPAVFYDTQRGLIYSGDVNDIAVGDTVFIRTTYMTSQYVYVYI